MESSGLLSILWLFLFLPSIQGSTVSDWLSPKRCPRIREQCEFQERDHCTKDRHCADKKKCCLFSCGKKCLDLRQDICQLPKETGVCMAYFRRWWYDKENNTCSMFIYGGCQGNSNNFQSKTLCQNFCQKRVKKCPRIRTMCDAEETDLCSKSQQCPKDQKCCKFSCGKKCLDVTQDVK
ncbi:PREDICTED: eppin-like [Elephantulus edwardii]|uniref:eppin-like n=1 Tax=Elephantulus edwardii TaxID=28737 RepID=UPI0003F0DF96|nr:PREDICTED: eppin-like [Elephantulus edwardii]